MEPQNTTAPPKDWNQLEADLNGQLERLRDEVSQTLGALTLVRQLRDSGAMLGSFVEMPPEEQGAPEIENVDA